MQAKAIHNLIEITRMTKMRSVKNKTSDTYKIASNNFIFESLGITVRNKYIRQIKKAKLTYNRKIETDFLFEIFEQLDQILTDDPSIKALLANRIGKNHKTIRSSFFSTTKMFLVEILTLVNTLNCKIIPVVKRL